MSWKDALFFNGDKPAGTLKDQFQKFPGRSLKNRRLLPITKIRKK
jgi:hypothetical protein